MSSTQKSWLNISLGGFVLNWVGQQRTTVNCLTGLQQYTLFYVRFIQLRFICFLGSVRLWFHNSYTAVQSLLTVLTYSTLCQAFLSICGVPDIHLAQAVVYIFLCGYERVYFQGKNSMQSSATVAFIQSNKLHVLIACNHSKLCILPLSVTVQFPRGHDQENECLDCANIQQYIHISLILCWMTSSRESVEWNLPLNVLYLKPLLNIVATAIKYMTINNVWQVVFAWSL